MIIVLENKKLSQYELHFQYDPVLVEVVKDVPGRSWNPDKKFWTIPSSKLGFFLGAIKGTEYEYQTTVYSYEDINVNAPIGTTTKIPNIDISDVTIHAAKGCNALPHQLDFLKYAIDRQRRGKMSGFLLADAPGAGKTFEVCQLALYNRRKLGVKHCLVICCVNSAKYNWVEDITKHTQGQEVPYLLGTRLKKNGQIKADTGNSEKLQDLETGHMYGDINMPELPFFLVINIESVRYAITKKSGRKFAIADKIIQLINERFIGMIALDEIHRNASPSSSQGQQILRIKKRSTAPVEWIPMTGTPITNRPTDVFLPTRLIDAHQSNSFYAWCQTFCIYAGYNDKEVIAYKNIPKLKKLLEPNMIRRRKEDVMDLPPKIYHVEYIENTSYQSRLYKSVESELIEDKDNILKSPNPLAQFLKLRQVNSAPELVDDSLLVDSHYLSKNAKLKRLLELVDDIVANGEKVVVFSLWSKPLATLYSVMSKRYGVCCYTGSMSEKDREAHKHAFISNPKYSVILGTVGALGTSHTLTVANNVIFYDKPWSPADIEQCEDRCHRTGTTQSVNVYSLVTKNTVEERIEDLLNEKEGWSDYIVDDKIDLVNDPKVFDMLLGINS